METLYLPKQLSLPVKDIIYLESDSNYTNIYSKRRSAKTLVALSLCKIQEALTAANFVRVNRSFLINISYVKRYEEERNTVCLTLTNNIKLRSSRRRTALVLNSLKNFPKTYTLQNA